MRQVKFVMSSAIIMNKVACAPVERQAFRRRAIMKQCVSDCVSIVNRLGPFGTFTCTSAWCWWRGGAYTYPFACLLCQL